MKGDRHDANDGPGAITDTRTVVIVLLAVALSVGAALATVAEVGPFLGPWLAGLAGVSAGGATAVLLIRTLQQLIAP
jgi:hypothetical protein